MMHQHRHSQSGFSLIELMIAMAFSLLIILGISTVFSSLKSTSLYSQQLENKQEALRFTHSIFSRAIHRANEVSDGSTLVLTFNLDNLDKDEDDDEDKFVNCLGEGMTEKYTETYELEDNELICTTKIASTSLESSSVIGINIEGIDFTLSGKLVTVTITPKSFIPDTNSDEVNMIFALRQTILGL